MPYGTAYGQPGGQQAGALPNDQRNRITQALMQVQNPPPATQMPQQPPMGMLPQGGAAPGGAPMAPGAAPGMPQATPAAMRPGGMLAGANMPMPGAGMAQQPMPGMQQQQPMPQPSAMTPQY